MGKFAGFVLAAALVGVAAAQPQMLRLNVAALDGRGQPVADLTKADFQIQDAGKDQPIAFFHANNHPAGVVSHATIVLFDLLNADMTNRGFSTDEIVRSLQGRETSDFLYFYLLTADIKLQPVHPLPNSMADVHPGEAPWTRNIRTLLDDALKNANRLRQSGLTEDDRVRRTYEALAQVVSTIAMIPGQKNIVWISRGIPISLRLASGGEAIDYKPLVRKFTEACTRAKVTVYTVNPSTSAVPSEGELASVETLQQISNLTGGRLFTSNSIGRAVSQAADQWRGEYTLAYAPTADNWDGKLHKVKVTSARRGVELLFPDAYYAERPDAAAATRGALQTAVSSPFDSPEMRLRVTGSKGRFQIRVGYDDALVTEKDGRFNASLVLTIVDYTAKGPKAIAAPASMNVTMTPEQRATAVKEGILLTQDRPVGEGIERMRFIVYDPATGLVGSLTTKVD
jgi:VWFA-related protein